MTDTTRLLANIRVMVTRPVHQAQPFCDMLTEQGAQVIRLPVIEIVALTPGADIRNRLAQIEHIEFALFISPNAVELGLAQLLQYGPLPDTLKLVTIGKASALKMQQILGREPDIYPTEQYNSEALLALESLQSPQVKNTNIIIFRGQGGRELLADSLRQRGAQVHYAEVYQRRRPEVTNNHLADIWEGDSVPDIITLSSNEALNNLLAMHDQSSTKQDGEYLQQLYQTPLVVVTEKMQANARKQGFNKQILVAIRASNEALLETVLKWAKMRMSAKNIKE